MHNREGAGGRVALSSRGSDLAAIAPLVAVIVALGVYPNFVTSRERGGHGREAPRRAGVAAGVTILRYDGLVEPNHETAPPETARDLHRGRAPRPTSTTRRSRR